MTIDVGLLSLAVFVSLDTSILLILCMYLSNEKF